MGPPYPDREANNLLHSAIYELQEEELPILLLSRALIKERKEQEGETTGAEAVPDKKLLEVAGMSPKNNLKNTNLFYETDAVTVLASENALQREREELEKLKEDKKKLEAAEREKQRLASIAKPVVEKAPKTKEKADKEEEKEKAKEVRNINGSYDYFV